MARETLAGMIYVLNFQEPIPNDTAMVVNTTSRATVPWMKALSPFFLPGGKVWTGDESVNVENAWQYSKVYPKHADDNEPTDAYFDWARSGWRKQHADRYPMGRDAKPLYCLWDNQKLDYLTSKEQIYIPLYARSVTKTPSFERLTKIYSMLNTEFRDLVLLDFDAYDHRKDGLKSYKEVVRNPAKKFGHAFVLAMLLDKKLDQNFKLM